jgi:hypothetical protein
MRLEVQFQFQGRDLACHLGLFGLGLVDKVEDFSEVREALLGSVHK